MSFKIKSILCMLNRLKMIWKKLPLGKFAFEFFSILLAVISAFALSNWNDDRRERNAEDKILLEINSGLQKDLFDIDENIAGHKTGIEACRYHRKLVLGQSVNLDSFAIYNFYLTRDFVSIQNNSGYETLKSKGLELIQDDSLRSTILSLYEYDYEILYKLEETYDELQFHQTYFKPITDIMNPYMLFNDKGFLTGITLPFRLNANDKNRMLLYLMNIERNRMFILNYYEVVKVRLTELSSKIESELRQNPS